MKTVRQLPIIGPRRCEEDDMRRVIVLASLALGLVFMLACGSNRGDAALQGAANLVLPTAIAQDPGGAKGCSIIGSWTTTLTPNFAPEDPSDVNIPWLATMNGQSEHAGTIVTTVPLWPVPFGPSGAVKVTDMRGVWERTGANTFKFTQIGWGLNANNVGVIAFRNSGTTTLVEDCTVSKTVSTMEALTPNLVLIPELSQPVPTMTAYRIVLSPPAELP